MQLVFNETNTYSPILCLVCSRTHLRLATWFIFKDIDDDFLIEDENGKTLSAKIVFTGFINALMSHLLLELTNRGILGSLLEKNNISWVLTVPSIWTESAKKFMRSCATEASIVRTSFVVQQAVCDRLYSLHIEVYWYDVIMVIHSRMDWITCIKKQQCHAHYITLIFPTFLSQYLGPPNHYRIVTGLPIFSSSILIYKELGWESLAERRKRRKLQMFYKIIMHPGIFVT